MCESNRYFATTPLGLEEPLADELRKLGAARVSPARAGVSFEGPLATGYRACLWSRTASRILLELGSFPAATPEALYEGVLSLDWDQHMSPEHTFAVGFTSVGSQITHTNFGALKVKDAIADWFRERTGRRPSVDRKSPDLSIQVHVDHARASVSLDLSGESLHRRTWRGRQGPASLKENLAAGILLLAGWPEVAAEGGPLVDPMCGAGTLPIEAALMAADVAPGLLRRRFGFEKWRRHSAETWRELLDEARRRDRRSQPGECPLIHGCDRDERMVRYARQNAQTAGVETAISFERRELALVDAPPGPPGILVANPPYGERLPGRDLELLYRRLGLTLKLRFPGFTGFILTGRLEMAKHIGMRVARRHLLYNGPIECRLLAVPVLEAHPDRPLPPVHGEMFANRLRKNLRRLRKWAANEEVSCLRVYDADLPEFAFSVERYGELACVRERERPKEIDPLRAEQRLSEGLRRIGEVFQIPPESIWVKQRQRQRGSAQYEKQAESGVFHEAREGGLRFLLNLTDYFDTGLFLDHRPIRALIGRLAQGRRFLNLFAYTGTATVYAAQGGAKATTSVDLSRTYVDWCGKNLALNGFRGQQHQTVPADVLEWLGRARARYDLIFLDPPTFSNSKSMRRDFDVQRDHVWLLKQTARRLSPDGILLFSTNFRRFKLDVEALPELACEDITRTTIPPDFQRNQRIHQCWQCVLSQAPSSPSSK